MKKDKENYIVQVNCMNCKENADWAIPNGKRVGDFLKGKKCTLCGCRFVVNKTIHFSVTNNREEDFEEETEEDF